MPSEIYYFLISASPETNWADDIPAIASGCIALLALFTTLYQSHLMRKHNRLSVRPHLAIHSEENENSFKITIKNDGLGPATIEIFEIYYKNIMVEGTGEKLIAAAFKDLAKCQLTALEAINTPFVLPASHTIEIASLEFDQTLESIEDYLNEHLRINIKYSSIYGEYFYLDTSD